MSTGSLKAATATAYACDMMIILYRAILVF